MCLPMQSLFSTLITIQALIFLALVHSALMSCKMANDDPTMRENELASLAAVIPQECPEFPPYVFSLSDYLIESNPRAARELVK